MIAVACLRHRQTSFRKVMFGTESGLTQRFWKVNPLLLSVLIVLQIWLGKGSSTQFGSEMFEMVKKRSSMY